MKNYLLFSLTLLMSAILFSCSDSDDEPKLEISTPEIVLEKYTQQTQTVKIETNSSWTAKTSWDWIKVEPSHGKSGVHDIKLTFDENTYDYTREGFVRIAAGDLEKRISIKQQGIARIDISVQKMIFNETEEQTFTLKVDNDWQIESNQSWLDVNPTSGKAGEYTINVKPTALNTEAIRKAKLKITADGNNKTVNISQKSIYPYYKDKDVVQLQEATIGKGIDLVFMGDGFTAKDLDSSGSGEYEMAIREAVEHFFDINPYRQHREYFNVYMVVAESEEEGVSGEFGPVRNAFETTYGEGTRIDCNKGNCMLYTRLIQKVTGKLVTDSDLNEMATIVVLNSKKYAGTCYYFYSGYSIALSPMTDKPYPNNFKNVIQHEAGGHGFGRLTDEYVNRGYENVYITEADKSNIREVQMYGFGYNVSITYDNVSWRELIGHPDYPLVGRYEGARYYGKGVWRSEEISCMNKNISYYNAFSRWRIIKRIMNIAGFSYTFSDFLEDDIRDNPNDYMTTKSSTEELPPLAPPVMMGDLPN